MNHQVSIDEGFQGGGREGRFAKEGHDKRHPTVSQALAARELREKFADSRHGTTVACHTYPDDDLDTRWSSEMS